MTSKDKGILYFAFNNEKIDYIRLAYLSAITAKYHLSLPVTLVTDQKVNLAYSEIFDEIIIIDASDRLINQQKIFSNARYEHLRLTYKNSMQLYCYEYSPYEKTIMLDTDYLVFSDRLLSIFNCNLPFMANYRSMHIGHESDYSTKSSGGNLPTLWSTVIYFDRSNYSKTLFDLVSFIRENWQYYYSLYGITTSMYRNDYVLGIAHHIMQGSRKNIFENNIDNGIAMLLGTSDIIDMPSIDNLTVLVETKKRNEYILGNWSKIDLHVQNKWAIEKISNRIEQFYG